MTRDEIRSVRCPRCSARPGERCIQDGRRRPANPQQRIGLAELHGWRGASKSREGLLVKAQERRRADQRRR